MLGVKETEGDLKMLFSYLLKNPEKIFKYFQILVNTFEELLAATEPLIMKRIQICEHFLQ